MKPKFMPFVLLAMLTMFALSSCSSAPSWLRGSWSFDKERTQAELTKQTAGSQAGTLASMGAGIDDQLMQQISKMDLVFTGSERIVTVNGQGQSDHYKLLESTADKCALRLKGGTVETYYRDGDEIYSFSTGTMPFKLYMKRQP